MIDKKLRERLIKGFKNLIRAFKDAVTMNSLTHHMFMLSLKRISDLDTISDIKLIMLCGKFDLAFPAGDYGYKNEQNNAINELEDAIFELKQL